jgi:hypothetical protein
MVGRDETKGRSAATPPQDRGHAAGGAGVAVGAPPRDAAYPALTDAEQEACIGSAGGGPYGAGAPREH